MHAVLNWDEYVTSCYLLFVFVFFLAVLLHHLIKDLIWKCSLVIMLSDLIVIALKPNKARLISCYFVIINESNNMTAIWSQCRLRHFWLVLTQVTAWHPVWKLESAQFETQIAVVTRLETDLVSSHPCLPVSLFICSPWSTSLCFPLYLSLYQITSRRWLIRSASSSGNTDRSWRRWDESGSGRRRRLTRRRSAGSDSAFSRASRDPRPR